MINLFFSSNNFVRKQESQKIIDEMNKNSSKYLETTKGTELNFNKKLFYNWIKDHYKIFKKTDFVVVDDEKNDKVIVLSIENFDKFF